MSTSQKSGVIQRLCRAVRDGAALTDGQLLEEYISRRDEAALAALVRRHGPMVWGVCRRVLRNDHDAEDAFQATFLVLVRKAASIASRELLANWLYGVAHQTGLKARATAAKRKGRESQVKEMPEPEVTQHEVWHDLQPLLDEEMSRLPDKYRVPIVLCDLEGKTRKEAAQLLGCPEGTVAGRLARARVMLAKRLARRGVTLSGGALAAVLAEKVAAAGVPASVVSSTIKVASLFTGGKAAGVISAKVAALTEGVVQAMFVTKIKSVLTVMLVLAVLAGGAGLLYPTQAAEEPKDAQKKAEEKPVPAQPSPQPAKTDRERMVGNWFIMNDDSGRKGEMWVITEDSILMHAKQSGPITQRYAHRLDADKDPKQIDIRVTFPIGPPGLIKGIYAFDGDEVRFCLGDLDDHRPTVFPKKPKPGEVLILQRATPGGTSPKAKEEKPAKSDRERMVGNWFIMNEDSGRKGEFWLIDKDRILKDPQNSSPIIQTYSHKVDAGKTPKQIDITVTRVNGPVIGIINGIYALDGDELRLCLAAIGKDRPAAFPQKPGPGEVLILKRVKDAAQPPKAKDIHSAVKPEEKVLTPEEAIKQKLKAEEAIKQSQEKVTVKFKVTAAQVMRISKSNVVGENAGFNEGLILKYGDRFAVQLLPLAMDTIRRLGIEPEKHFKGKVVQVTGVLQPGQPPVGTGEFQIVVKDLTQIEVVEK